jgi:hypothetical protein
MRVIDHPRGHQDEFDGDAILGAAVIVCLD